MNQSNLILHCGAAKAERSELALVCTPDADNTWCPIPHQTLVAEVEGALTRANMRIVTEAHGLSADGARYFGLLQVANGDEQGDYSYVLGLRNSHDKRFPAGLVVGSSVFVCDNLSFSGEIKIARKHTRHIMRDLPGLVSGAVGQLGDRWHAQAERIDSYRAHELNDAQAHDLVIRALDNRAIKEVTTFLNRELLAKALRFGLTKIEIIDSMSPLRFSQGGRQMIVMPVRANGVPTQPTPTPVSPPAATHQEPPAPNPPPSAEQPKENTMPEKTNANTNTATPPTSPEKPALEIALAQIEVVRGDFRNAIAGLNKLADSLKQVQRVQKAGDREIQTVRQTLRSLQSVRI